MPVALTAELSGPISVALQPRWRVTNIEIRRAAEGIFDFKLTIVSDEVEDPSEADLRVFRDLVVSLVAFSAMVPVELRSMGTFDFPVDDKRRKAISLGAMEYELPSSPLRSLRPLALGLELEPHYRSALHFLWEALNAEHPLYRFINLAVAIELLVRHDSPVEGSRHPICGDPNCAYELESCPKCDRSWKIPTTLRERAAFLLPPEILSQFIQTRNQVFHGLKDTMHHEDEIPPSGLNTAILLIIRNYVGGQMRLPVMTREQLGIAVTPPKVSMTVYYELPPDPSAPFVAS